jgi:hypothetical protein
MHDELIGYLLGALNRDELVMVEEYLAAQPDAGRHLEALRRGLEPLETDGGHLDPPEGLALRTCQIVRIHIESIQVDPPNP